MYLVLTSEDYRFTYTQRYDKRDADINMTALKKANVSEYLMHEDLPIRTKGSGCF